MTDAALAVIAALSFAAAILATAALVAVRRRTVPTAPPSTAGVVHDPELAAELAARERPATPPPVIPAGVVEVHKGRRVKPKTHKPPS